LILALAVNRIVGIQKERVEFHDQRSKDAMELRTLRHMKKKVEHGCWDAHCDECDIHACN
jgi:hypothetical protein